MFENLKVQKKIVDFSLNTKKQKFSTNQIKFFIEKDGREIARAFLVPIFNQLHKKPYGLLEDVFVEEEFQGMDSGTKLVLEAEKEAKALGFYKIIATSRFIGRAKVHQFYKRLDFNCYGYDFRKNL